MSIQTLLDQFAARLAVVEAAIGTNGNTNAAASTNNAAAAAPTSRAVSAFDGTIGAQLAVFSAACDALGGDYVKLCGPVKDGFNALRGLIDIASKSKKPAQGDMPALLAGIQKAVKDVGNPRLCGRDAVNHQKALGEGLQGLSWVMITPAPVPFLEAYRDGFEFWANKIRVQYKSTDRKHVEFADSFKELMVVMMAYVKEHHTTGLTWNAKGGDATAATPAPTPAPAPAPAPAATPAPAGDMFAELKKKGDGLSAAGGLKTVTKDMQTWRADYKATNDIPVAKKKAAPVAVKAAAPVVKKAPVKSFARHKHTIEYYSKDEKMVEVEANSVKDQVYVYKCTDCAVIITGKCKSIVLDSCKKVQVVMESAISSLELVNCARMKVQVKGSVPSLAIDKTDGVLVYLSKDSLGVEILASKSSEMNVAIPKDGCDDDFTEICIPEQYIHRIKDGAITADVSDLYSH